MLPLLPQVTSTLNVIHILNKCNHLMLRHLEEIRLPYKLIVISMNFATAA